jgi:hypothetical protein
MKVKSIERNRSGGDFHGSRLSIEERESKLKRLIKRLLYWSIVASLCLAVYFAFLYVSNISTFDGGSVAPMVYGTAKRPYVYRTLLPSLVRITAPLIPDTAVRETISLRIVRAGLSRFEWEAYPAETLLMFIGMYLCVIGSFWAFRHLMISNGFNSWSASWLPFGYLVMLPGFFSDGKYYDWPTLFLFTLALSLLKNKHWTSYILVLLFTSLSKETSILLILVFAVHYFKKLARPTWLSLLGIQTLVYLTVRLALIFYYRFNPGGVVEYHLQDNLIAFQEDPLTSLLPIGLMIILIGHRWQEKPRFLRDALFIVGPLGLTKVFFGMPYELRVYLEAFPVILLLMAGGIFRSDMIYREPVPGSPSPDNSSESLLSGEDFEPKNAESA